MTMVENKKDIQIKNKLIFSLTFISVICFILGISLPIFTNTKFFFFRDDISLLKSLQILFSENDFFLGVIILLFTIVTPILKYIFILTIQFSDNPKLNSRLTHLLSIIGKWAMLDVFVIALIIITMKIDGGIFEVEMKSGTIFFTISIIISIIISNQIIKI